MITEEDWDLPGLEVLCTKPLSPLSKVSCSVVPNSLRLHGLLCPWNSPGKNTGVGSHYLLQGIFPTQASNPGLPHCRCILYHPSHQGSLDGKVASLPQLVWGLLWFVCSSKHSCGSRWPYIGRGDNLTSLHSYKNRSYIFISKHHMVFSIK